MARALGQQLQSVLDDHNQRLKDRDPHIVGSVVLDHRDPKKVLHMKQVVPPVWYRAPDVFNDDDQTSTASETLDGMTMLDLLQVHEPG